MEEEIGAGIIIETDLDLTDISMVGIVRVLIKEPQHKACFVTMNYGLRFYCVPMAGYLNWRLRGRLFTYSEQDLFSPLTLVRR